jgi:hypothetical protein
MKQILWVLLVTGLSLGASRAWAQSGITQQNGRQVTCASDDGKRHNCRVDTSRGVTMVNQRSGSPCIQGQTWGYTSRGIWVDRGCRADFVLRSNFQGGGPGYGGPGYGGPGYGGPGPGYGPPQGGVITCSSNDGKRNYCPANIRGGVRLTNQRSGSPCIQGQTWGWDNRGIWVDRGCRADFALR